MLSCVYIKAEECYAEQTSVAIACDTVDYTKGLSVWFDTPNDLSGKEIWTVNTGTLALIPILRGNSDLFR